jgi:hypothetical protein
VGLHPAAGRSTALLMARCDVAWPAALDWR